MPAAGPASPPRTAARTAGRAVASVVAVAGLASPAACRRAQPGRAPSARPPYLDVTKPVDERVADLLGRLTLNEKIALVHANGKFSTAGVPRLGIPARQLSDGPHGVREEMSEVDWRPAGHTDDFATWLPVSVALAATWNPDLAYQYAVVLGHEARARGKAVMLGPGVNIQRTPLGGRNFEYFSEDPFLSARMAVPWITGLQAQQVAACVKHFALNNQEWDRDTHRRRGRRAGVAGDLPAGVRGRREGGRRPDVMGALQPGPRPARLPKRATC